LEIAEKSFVIIFFEPTARFFEGQNDREICFRSRKSGKNGAVSDEIEIVYFSMQ